MSINRFARDGRREALGVGLALFSAATFGTSGSLADALMQTGWTPGAVVTFRITLAALLLTVPAVISLHGRWRALRHALPAAIGFGLLAVAGCQLFFFNAVQHLAVSVALLLEYSGILLVVLWLWIRHGHRPGALTVTGGAAAIGGLLLVLHPGAGQVDPVGIGWGLLAGAGLAVYFVLSSRADESVPPLVLAWAGMVVGALSLIGCDVLHVLPFRMRTHDVELLHHRTSWWTPVIGLGLVAAAIAYAAGVAASRMLGAKVASFVGLTEVLFATVIAWLLLGQTIGWQQLVGGAVVLAGIILVRADESAAVLPTEESALLAT